MSTMVISPLVVVNVVCLLRKPTGRVLSRTWSEPNNSTRHRLTAFMVKPLTIEYVTVPVTHLSLKGYEGQDQ